MDPLLNSPASVEVRLPIRIELNTRIIQILTCTGSVVLQNMQDLQQMVRTKALLHLLSLANAECTTAADEVFGVLRYE
jgi:hypothetical protein